MTKQDKVAKVMHEWKQGKLTSHGKVVEDYDQAIAIALSEAGLSKKMEEGAYIENENALMVENNNKQIAHHTKEMEEALKDTDHVPAWVVAKVNRSASDLSDATHYLEGEEKEKYDKGGEFEDAEDFIEDVKEMHEAIDYIVLKDGTRIEGEKLMRKGGEMYAVGGEIGNTVTFSRYGERTTGRITDKLRNGYEVVTDEGTILVEPQEVISFSDEPIAKKKRFGFFEGGGSVESAMSILKEETNQYSMNKYGEPIDEDTFMVSGIKKDGEDVSFRFIVAETVSGKDIKLTPSQIFDVDREDKFAGGGEIENKIEKLKKVVSSKMLPESVKAKAQAEIDKLEKELHESKETKAEEKAEHEDFDKRKSELVKSKHKGEKEISFIKSEKVTEIEDGKESENFFKTGEAIYGTIVSENSKQYLVKSSNKDGVEYLVNKDAVKLISVKTPSKPTTRKAPVKKAVVKKVEVKKDLPKIKVGDTIKVYATNGDLIIDEVFKNDKGEVSYRGKYIANDNLKSYHSSKKVYEYILNEKDIIVKTPAKPKADHKKLVAKLKAKKEGKEYDNRASINPKTGERYKRSESSDKKREAKPLGKRVSADGSIYYENRLNRGDLSKKDNFEKGGEVKGSDWGLNLNW